MVGNNILAINDNGKLHVKKEEDSAKEITELLYNSKDKGEIITDRICGVETMSNNSVVVATLYRGDYKIMIPVDECIDMPENTKPGNMVDYEKKLLVKRIHSEIDFKVNAIDEKTGMVVASRKQAMQQKRKSVIFNKIENGDYLLTDGTILEARVVCTARSGIIVEAFGCETFIPCKELSYQRIADASQKFSTGDYVLCKVLSIVRNKETFEASLELSVKQYKDDPYPKMMKRYILENKYAGTVSMIDGDMVFIALRGGVDVLCKMPDNGVRPYIGAKVTVRISQKNDEMNRIFGVITYVQPIN